MCFFTKITCPDCSTITHRLLLCPEGQHGKICISNQRLTKKQDKLKVKIRKYFQKANNATVIDLTGHLKTETITIRCGEYPNVDIPVTGIPDASSARRQTTVKGAFCPTWELLAYIQLTGRHNLLAET